MPNLPKLSYVLLSHNREQYIRTAVESAFAQDYEGELEYIFSDDCSTDRTYEILKECVAAYKGPRRVVLTQTPRNLHLAGHTNHAAQFVESDWIIRADDDDISAVDRCTLIGRAIASHPRASMVLGKVVDFTDEQEADIRQRAAEPCAGELEVSEHASVFSMLVPGQHWSLKAWSMQHFRQFGNLEDDAYYVDDVTAMFRCGVLGSALFFDHPVVYARQGSQNMCRGGDDGQRGYEAIIKREQFNQKYHSIIRRPMRAEIAKLSDYISKQDKAYPEQEEILRFMAEQIQVSDLLCNYWSCSTLDRLRVRRQLGSRGLFSLLRCLPLPVFARLLAIYRALFKR